MPFNLNITPKPQIAFANPDGMTVFNDTPTSVELILTPRAEGKGKIFLSCIANEVSFKDVNNNQISSEISIDFDSRSASGNLMIDFPFTLVCSDPSDQDILIRFDAKAKNSAGEQSPPIMQLPVTFKSRAASRDMGDLTLSSLIAAADDLAASPPERPVDDLPPAVAEADPEETISPEAPTSSTDTPTDPQTT